MENNRKEEDVDDDDSLEDFIHDWYWNKPSHRFARQIGKFLLDFIEHIKNSGVSTETVNKHANNCWHIGKFECDYGSHKKFSPDILIGGEFHMYEFKRKVSDSKYSVNSYLATCRKLSKYVRALRSGMGSDKQENNVAQTS